MRRLLLAAAMFGVVQGAQAADLPDLPVLRGAFPEGLRREGGRYSTLTSGSRAGRRSQSRPHMADARHGCAALPRRDRGDRPALPSRRSFAANAAILTIL